LQYYTDEELNRPGIRMFDIHLPNLCNLRCSICGPYDSSLWYQDAKTLGLPLKKEWEYNKDIDYHFKNLEIPDTLEYIKFWGGEPLLTNLHADFLELLNNKGLLSKIRLMYNTNGTVKVSDRVLDLWEKSRLVELWFSIDDIADRFNYQRYGANWDQVVDNMGWYYDNLPHNHLMYISCSYGALNIWSLPDVVEWHKKNFSQSRYKDPVQLVFNKVIGPCSIDYVSPEFYKQLEQRFLLYPELLAILKTIQIKPGYQPDLFLDYVARLDVIRGTSFLKTFPEYNV
jgi:sulfatase maturation enzyme AslB (radical SAM superfamily)